ncbi:MAG: phosphatase PAP2 family protein [Fimbriimonadaceae bacterium]|nr:phosphatase PAP2 family protein [Fimbriimonadaceae bacterium]
MFSRRPWPLRSVLPFALLLLLPFDYWLCLRLDVVNTPQWPAYRLFLDHAAHVLGDGLNLFLVGLLLYLLGDLLERATWRAGGRWVMAAVLLAGFWSQAIKHLIGRPRPRFYAGDGLWVPCGPTVAASWDSFPSGHAATVTAVALVLAATFPRLRAALLGLAAAVTVGRVYGGDHFVTDILCGALLGWQLGNYAAGRARAESCDAVA